MSKITKEMTIKEVIENHPEALDILSEVLEGQCFGCPMSQVETLAEAAEHHGKNIDELLEKLNKK